VSVSARVLLLPAATLPKLRLAGLGDSCPGVVPVPAKGTFKVEFAAFELTATFPLTLPLDEGEKLTLKLALWPTANVNGSVNPDALNPDPLAFTPEIVTLAAPEFVRISVTVCEAPTRTSEKVMLLGLGVSCPELIPVPDMARVTVVEPEGELVCPLPPVWVVTTMDTLPVSVPADGGVNVIVHVTLCPPARVIG
jgi:hypothetical protein